MAGTDGVHKILEQKTQYIVVQGTMEIILQEALHVQMSKFLCITDGHYEGMVFENSSPILVHFVPLKGRARFQLLVKGESDPNNSGLRKPNVQKRNRDRKDYISKKLNEASGKLVNGIYRLQGYYEP